MATLGYRGDDELWRETIWPLRSHIEFRYCEDVSEHDLVDRCKCKWRLTDRGRAIVSRVQQ